MNVEGYKVSVDLSESTLNKKVRNAQLEQYNYIAVIGEEEKNGGYVDLRERDNQERLVIYPLIIFYQNNNFFKFQFIRVSSPSINSFLFSSLLILKNLKLKSIFGLDLNLLLL